MWKWETHAVYVVIVHCQLHKELEFKLTLPMSKNMVSLFLFLFWKRYFLLLFCSTSFFFLRCSGDWNLCIHHQKISCRPCSIMLHAGHDLRFWIFAKGLFVLAVLICFRVCGVCKNMLQAYHWKKLAICGVCKNLFKDY